MACHKFITVPTIREYEVAEAILTAAGEFVLILYHPNELWPSLHARVRYIDSEDKRFVAFTVKSLNENFSVAGTAHEVLEFGLITLAEEILKCMYVKSVMTGM